ncbi:MAG: metallophosphoesterase family protein [Prochlorotrichaceae cyanobacterium]
MANSPPAPTPSTPTRRWVISDVHGQYNTLVQLLSLMSPTSSDEVYFVGDLIDRGADSRKVVKLVREEGYTTLVGNHEQMMIESFQADGEVSVYDLHAWMANGGDSTFESYQQDLEALWQDVNWFRKQPYSLDLDDIWLVHAGVNPAVALADQVKDDLCWIRDDFHRIEHPYFEDKLIVIGHTITFTFPQVNPGELVRGVGWLGIDTGAYHPRSGWLTAIDLNQWEVYQCNVHTQESRIRPCADLEQQYAPRRRATKSPVTWPFWFSA